MKLLLALGLREFRSLLRSTRGWVASICYIAAGSAPALLVAVREPHLTFSAGSGTVAAETFALLPWLAAIYAFVTAVEVVEDDRTAGAWYSLLVPSLSNAGYLVRRVCVFALILVPVAVVPVVVAYVVAWTTQGAPPQPSPFLIPLLGQVLPILVSFAALGVGAGTLGRGFFGGTVVAVAALALADYAAEHLLSRPPGTPAASLSWLGTVEARWLVLRLRALLAGDAGLFPLPASDTPWQLGPAIAQLGVMALPVFWVGPLVLACSSFFLGRTRRSLRPWKLATSRQVGTLARVVQRIRVAYSPDAFPARADWALLAVVLLLHAGSFGAIRVRSSEFFRWAAETVDARSAVRATTPKELGFERLRLTGSIDGDGVVATEMSAELTNRGDRAVGELAFSLNRDLRLLTAQADDGRGLEILRRGDRVSVTLGEELPPGAHLGLRFELRGEPRRYAVDLPNWHGFDTFKRWDFDRAYDYMGRFNGRWELSASYVVPPLSARRAAFRFSDLAPLARYSAWGPGEATESPDPAGGVVLRESHRPPVAFDVDLSVPTDLVLADSCGHWSLGPDHRPTGRLAGSCEVPLTDFVIAGGHLQPVVGTGARIAGLPDHARLLRTHAQGLADEVGGLARAWPDLPVPESLVFIEWPEPTVHRLSSRDMRVWGDMVQEPVMLGRLVLLPEILMISRDPVDLGRRLEGSLASTIAGRRPSTEGESWVIERLVAELLRRSLGSAPANGAVVPSYEGGPAGIEVPLASVPIDDKRYWRLRFPAIVAALEEAIGPEPLRRVVEDYLADSSAGPAGLDELLDRIAVADEPGGDLADFIDHDLRRGEIARLALGEAAVARTADGWRVTGELINTGSAPTVCPVEVVSESGAVSVDVPVAENGRAGFTATVSWRPSAVVLDRLNVCHRYRPAVARERVDLS